MFLQTLFLIFCMVFISSPSFSSFLQEEKEDKHSSHILSSKIMVESDKQEIPPRLILSIDGGGIRGILPALILSWLEEQVEREIIEHFPKAPKPEVRLGECFDVMAGTSTGGLISLGLNVLSHGRPKYPCYTFVDLYANKGSLIFPPENQGLFSGLFSSKFEPQVLENILFEYFQEQTLKDLPKPVIITTYDIHQEELFVFNSSEAKSFKSKNYKLRDVARSTSAAPTYLPASQVQDEEGRSSHTFIDGGVTANNPSILGYLEAQKLYPSSRFHIISIGCGSSPLFTLDSKQSGGKLNWASDISSVIMNSSSIMNHQLISQMASLRGDKYTRVQFFLDQRASSLDNATPENIKILKGYAKREISNPQSPLYEVKQALLNFYRHHNYYVFFPLVQEIKQQIVKEQKTLNLSRQFLTERAFWEVADFINNNPYPFSRLDLSYNTLSPPFFTLLPFFENIKELNLSYTDLTEESLEFLKKVNLSHLEMLNLQGNPKLESIIPDKMIFLMNHYSKVLLDDSILYTLGQYYEAKKDFSRAAFYYTQGQKSFNKLALAKILLFPELLNESQNIHQGFTLCKVLAEEGDREAQYILGHLYASSEKEVKEYLEEQELIDKNQESIEITQRKSIQQASYWYRLSADQHHKSAAYALAGFYSSNKVRAPIPQKGVKDHRYQLIEAIKYYKIAKEAGSTSAEKHISELQSELDMLLK